ncbi:MAG: restriction endonuclease subunit S [Terrimicrobiaceae bacterium]
MSLVTPVPKPARGNPPTGSPAGVTKGNQWAKQGGLSSRLVPLDRVARHHSGNSKLIKGKLHDAPADNLFPAFSATGQDVWRDAFDREGDAIIISAVGARCGKCFLARGRWSAIANTHVVWPDPEKAEIKFLWYLLNDEQFWIRSGSAQPFVAVRKTFEKEIFVPPLPEQRRIVAEIEKQFTRLEAGVSALRRVQANLKRYRVAVLKAACEGCLVPTEAALARSPRSTKNGHSSYETGEALLARILTERRQNWQGRGQYKEPAAPETEKLAPLPEGWAWTSAEQLTMLVRSGSRGWGEFYSDTGLLFIRAQDIKTDSLKLDGVARVTLPTKAEGMRSSVENRDLLITITGANVTKSAIVRGVSEVAFVSQHVALLKPVCREAAAFQFLWIISPAHGRKTLEKWAYGAGKPGLSLEQVRSLPIALPPLAEQMRIVAEVERRLSVVEELESVVNANLQRATRLRQSILQRAFTGGLS